MFLIGVLAVIVAGLLLWDCSTDFGSIGARVLGGTTTASDSGAWFWAVGKTILAMMLLVTAGYVWGGQ